MDRLLREGNPPTGQLASPKPQYKDVQTNNWEELKGEGGASYVKDKDVFTKLEQARALLDAISGKDFATQTTLAAVLAKLADLESELATEDKLEQVRQLLSGVATEAKLEQARVLLNAISNKDFATQATLAAVLAKLEQLETEIQAVKANQVSGDQKVQLEGSNLALRQTIVTGAKTVVSTAAEIFAGASRLDNRHVMVITNMGADIVYIGDSGVTASKGFPLFPQDTLRIEFDPTSSVGVFACTSGSNVQVRVVELA